MSTTQPYPSDPYQRGSALSRGFLPLALITLGVVFLLGNLVPDRGRGGLVVAGLGLAFLIGRLTTGRYGYAVPAGILLAIGAYITAQQMAGVRGIVSSGLFFVLLGLGFGAIYAVGLRPAAIWPLFPATILLFLGVILLGVASLGPLASFTWIVGYWPMVLVVLGLWFLFRESLPVGARRPIATVGGLALLAYGVLAAAASVAAGGSLARTGVAPAAFGTSPFAETVTLDVPISSTQTFTVDNANGKTSIHGGAGSSVHVVATRHYSLGGQRPDVRLTPSTGGVTLDSTAARSRFPFGDSSSVDYAVEVPAGVAVKAQSSSGQLEIAGVDGAVDAMTSSGQLNLSNLGGAVTAQSSSGVVRLDNVAGDVRATTTSGQILGTGLQHVRQAQSSSGYISLEGTFTDAAQVTASSGAINLKLLPGSAVQLDVHTSSGSVLPQGLLLAGGVTRRDTLQGAIGTPAPGATLHVQTSSGAVIVSQ